MELNVFCKYTLLCLPDTDAAADVIAVGDGEKKDAADDDDCQNHDEWVYHYFQYPSLLSQQNL